MRVLLDTNVLVAAFATRGLCQDVLRLVLAEHSLLVSETILDELERTLTGKLRTPARRAREVVTFVREHGEVLAPASPAPWPQRDPDDRWIVAAALEGAADVLVTGDKDLLEASGGTECRVLTPRGVLGIAAYSFGLIPEAPRSSASRFDKRGEACARVSTPAPTIAEAVRR